MHQQNHRLQATSTDQGQAKQMTLKMRTWLPIAGILVLLGALVFIDEIFDIPHLLLGAEPTPINWSEAIFEAILITLIIILAVSRLIRGMIKLKQAEEEKEHLNLVLRAIRNINQLIVREKDRDRLLQGACQILIKTRGYYNTWIALFDELGELMTTAEAGLGENFLPMVERFKSGNLTGCAEKALAQSGVLSIDDPVSICGDCPLLDKYGDRGAMTVRLEYGGKVYGLWTVSMSADLIKAEEERILFEEVAQDLAFALHNIELEEERVRAEEALRVSQENFMALAENASDGIMIATGKGIPVYANKRAAEITGYSTTELLELSIKELAHPDEVKKVIERYQARLVEEPMPRQYETVIVRKDGDGVLIEFAGAKTVWQGEPADIVIFRDITERKQAEEALKEYSERLEEMVEERTQELKDAQEQLVRREKLAVLGRVSGGIAHELRNPLGVISNAVYYLQAALPDPDEKTSEYLQLIASEVGNYEKIINDLLDVSRTKAPQREATVVSELVAQTLERQPSPEGVEIATEMPDDLPQVFVDPRQIGQVMVNLVRNAYQAMPEGGKLTVQAKAKGKEVHLSVKDTGCGISKDNMKKLFEPLFTTKERGIGFGLVMSKKMVEANGGRIEAESDGLPGKGSTFTVRLPSGPSLRGTK